MKNDRKARLILSIFRYGKNHMGKETFYHKVNYGIVVSGEATLGDEVVIRQQVTIGNKGTGEGADDCPIIGDRVDIGAGAKIIGGITIGENSKIGANAVVTKSLPANSILVGVPARNIASKAMND